MSRKTILTIVAVIGAILTAFQEAFGLSINGAAVAAGLGAIVLYVLLEAKVDKERIRAQLDRFKDSKFWLAVISAALVALTESGVVLPVSPEVIIAVLTAIMGILFKAKVQTV